MIKLRKVRYKCQWLTTEPLKIQLFGGGAVGGRCDLRWTHGIFIKSENVKCWQSPSTTFLLTNKKIASNMLTVVSWGLQKCG